MVSQVPWLSGDGTHADVVLSSRVRLARNLAGFLFVHKAPKAQRLKVLELCKGCILKSKPAAQLGWVDVHQASAMQRSLLVERHLISKHHSKGRPLPAGSEKSPARGDDPRGVAISTPDELLSIMVNEEDHLRLQVIRPGLALDQAWAQADAADTTLEARLDYAYSPRLGYLTACPTNVGTGVRMSVMLHLPGLKLTGDIEKVKRAAADMNLAVRGFYGEGSEAIGDVYQISNQTTLGKSEKMILQELQGQILPKVIEYERHARRTLATQRSTALEDQVYRAVGLLTSARLMTAEEAMQLLSHVRLGVVLGILRDLPQAGVNQLLLAVQPAHLQLILGREMDQEERKAARATLLRQRLLAAKS